MAHDDDSGMPPVPPAGGQPNDQIPGGDGIQTGPVVIPVVLDLSHAEAQIETLRRVLADLGTVPVAFGEPQRERARRVERRVEDGEAEEAATEEARPDFTPVDSRPAARSGRHPDIPREERALWLDLEPETIVETPRGRIGIASSPELAAMSVADQADHTRHLEEQTALLREITELLRALIESRAED